jgi:NADH dehydrogenase FAD-containing subunit
LHSPQYPEIFGGGDCISFQPRPLDRVGVFAVRENPILLENLHAALSNGKVPFRAFKPQKVYLLILNMGNDTGIFNRKSLTFGGKFPFKLKDRIDRKFMKLFRVSGELDDTVDCDTWK